MKRHCSQQKRLVRQRRISFMEMADKKGRQPINLSPMASSHSVYKPRQSEQ